MKQWEKSNRWARYIFFIILEILSECFSSNVSKIQPENEFHGYAKRLSEFTLEFTDLFFQLQFLADLFMINLSGKSSTVLKIFSLILFKQVDQRNYSIKISFLKDEKNLQFTSNSS